MLKWIISKLLMGQNGLLNIIIQSDMFWYSCGQLSGLQ